MHSEDFMQDEPQQTASPQITLSPRVHLLQLLLCIFSSGIIFGTLGYRLGKDPELLVVPRGANDQVKVTPKPGVGAQKKPSPTPMASTTPEPTWVPFEIPELNLSFQYPSNLKVFSFTDDTSLAAEQQYSVAVEDSGITYLNIYLYKSDKALIDWWDTEGKQKFEKLKDDFQEASNSPSEITLYFDVRPTTLANNEALEISVITTEVTFATPGLRRVTLFRKNGFVVMTTYNEQGTTPPSMETSGEILSTFAFTD